MTAPIAPGESSIAPSTDSSASRFCGGTCGDCAGEGTEATWAMAPLKPQRRTASTAGDSQAAVGSEAANCRRKERPFASFSTAGGGRPHARPQGTGRFCRREREVHSALHRPVEHAVEATAPRSRSVSSVSSAPRAARARHRSGDGLLGHDLVVGLGRSLSRQSSRRRLLLELASSSASASARCASASACSPPAPPPRRPPSRRAPPRAAARRPRGRPGSSPRR